MANIKHNALAPSVDEAVLAAFRKLATTDTDIHSSSPCEGGQSPHSERDEQRAGTVMK